MEGNKFVSKLHAFISKNLNKSEVELYKQRLILKNGTTLTDPALIPEASWSSQMTKWPALEWPDIYTYIIDRPSEYTKESLKAYKSLDAYSYIHSGNVQEVMYYDQDVACKYNSCFIIEINAS